MNFIEKREKNSGGYARFLPRLGVTIRQIQVLSCSDVAAPRALTVCMIFYNMLQHGDRQTLRRVCTLFGEWS